MDSVDNRLPAGPDVVDIVIKIENPSERLLGWRDVVALRAEHHDGRTDIAQVDRGAVRCLNPAGSEIVSDEQLIDDELNLLRVQIDVAAPPLFEAQIAWRFRVDFGIEIVRLAPE